MEITVTKPIQEFIERQIAKGYSDPGEVARQALLRWMDEEELDLEPPQVREKLAAARKGAFQVYDPKRYDALMNSLNEAPG